MSVKRSPKFPNCCDFRECQCPKCQPKKKLCQVKDCQGVATHEMTYYHIEQCQTRLCESCAKVSGKWAGPDMKELKAREVQKGGTP